MKTTLFLNGRSQALRLPKVFRLPGKEVSIRRPGTGVLMISLLQAKAKLFLKRQSGPA